MYIYTISLKLVTSLVALIVLVSVLLVSCNEITKPTTEPKLKYGKYRMEITSLNTVIDLSINRDLEWEQKIQTYSDQGLLVVKHLEKGKVKLTTESNGIQILEFDKFSFNYDTMRPITNTRSIKIESYLGYELIVKENVLIADSEYGYIYNWVSDKDSK